MIGKVTHHDIRNGSLVGKSGLVEMDITAPSADAAKQWQGWGTALKPANEPICVARKPLDKGLTVAENVLKHGTGAINVDASRISAGTDLKPVFSGAKGKARPSMATVLFLEIRINMNPSYRRKAAGQPISFLMRLRRRCWMSRVVY